MTDEEVLAQLARECAERERLIREARENLEKYGTALAPVTVPAAGEGGALTIHAVPDRIVRLAPRAKKEIDPKWFKVTKVCPHCKEEKNVGRDFGIVVRRGLEHAAGWCKDCRSKTSGSYMRKAPPKKRR